MLTAGGNLILNGDFENNSFSVDCQTHMSNWTFNSYMADAIAFGERQSLSFSRNSACTALPPVSGIAKVGITSGTTSYVDAFSLLLSTPVVPGNTYTVSFSAHPEFQSGYTGAGSVEVGLSSSPTSFGILIFTGNLTLQMVWHNFSAAFTAPISASWLTVRAGPIAQSWSQLDAFSLLPGGIGTRYCRATINSTGLPADISAFGSASATAGILTLTSAPVPIESSLFFHGALQTEVPFGNGYLCTTAGIVRGALTPGTSHVATYTYNNTDTQHSVLSFVGSTRCFQHWYRDPMGGGALFNLSNAMSITILP